MRRRSWALAPILLVATGCALIPSSGAAVPEERMPGPAWYLVRVEPEEALDTHDIVLTTNGDHHVNVAEVMADDDPLQTGGTSILTIDGRRYPHGITVPWPPSFLEAAVDGTPCDGQVELTEDDEVDVTLVVAAERCALILDRRHRMEDGGHPLLDAAPS